VKQIALQKIPVRVIRAKPKIRIVKALVSPADLTAQRQENVSILIKRDEFDRIPRIVAFRRIGQKAPIGSGYSGRGSEAGFSCPIIRFAPAMTTSNTSACEILNTVCTRLSPVPQKWLACFAATRFALTSRATAPPEFCCCPVIRLNLRHYGSERNCWSNGKPLNLKDVSSSQTDEISTMVKTWTALELRNLR
jgi:hypothetical protein